MKTTIQFENSIDFAQHMDKQDPLRKYRERFHIPKQDGSEVIYFTGNSLGLQPKSARQFIEQEMEDWQNLGVEGHFKAKNPWYYYHHLARKELSEILGTNEEEIVCMNSLTANLNALIVSFYQPAGKRHKILIEENAFPSDYYAIEQQIRLHGKFPHKSIIEAKARDGEHTIRTEDILALINEHQDDIAMILLGGVNYYTGQYFDLPTITNAGHDAGAFVGFDLAHAAGNVILNLHEWGVDFATWCSYKYLNSGPGGVSGIFVHERHGNNTDLPRLAGWWGNDEESRFQMKKHFIPQTGAAGWQMSNAPVLPIAVHRAAIEIFAEAGMYELRDKSELLTGYLEYLINEMNKLHSLGLTILTPSNPAERGCQLSIKASKGDGKKIMEKLKHQHVFVDWREPDVIRLAPVPLYNTFEEVHKFASIIGSK